MTEGGISSHGNCCLRAWDTLLVPFQCILAGVSVRGSSVGFCRSCRL